VLVAGATTELLSLAAGEIQSVNHDVEPAGAFGVDRVVSQAAPADYDALILPGGTTNPDHLRQDSAAVAFAREFVDSGEAGRRDLPRPVDPRRGRCSEGPHAHLVAQRPD